MISRFLQLLQIDLLCNNNPPPQTSQFYCTICEDMQFKYTLLLLTENKYFYLKVHCVIFTQHLVVRLRVATNSSYGGRQEKM